MSFQEQLHLVFLEETLAANYERVLFLYRYYFVGVDLN